MSSTSSIAEQVRRFEEFIRVDPAGRGLLSTDDVAHPLCAGELQGAAADLAQRGKCVAIITGFFIPGAQIPSAETDGPPGALLLASALEQLGQTCFVITDEPCASAVRAAGRAYGFDVGRILSAPHESSVWVREFFTHGPGRELTHLISIERVGPSHTLASLEAQIRLNPAPIEKFTNEVPLDERDRCHNMRGLIIDEFTADLHRLFDALPQYRPSAKSIGIGDGGNEIGMGKIPWEELARRLPGATAPLIPCRVSADWNILAGTSNWGAFALAAATLLHVGRMEFLQPWDSEHQRKVLEIMVAEGPAVDGVTRLPQATVDGLPLLTYLQPWQGIRRILGLDP
ncbi:MAG: glutamate cyclase domain-containing protein [Planctomycetaceae bacterium]